MCEIIYSPKYSLYNLGEGHPFSPIRSEMVTDLLTQLGVMKTPVEPEPVSPEELYSIHDKEYVDAVELASSGEPVENIDKYGLDTQDNPIVKDMALGARYICGGTKLGAKLLLEGKAKKVLQLGGGLHHAHKNMAAGFCLYNDLALSIKEMTNHGWHVAYLDLDVHHGDGVQEIFYSDENVMTISLHETGEFLFPGTGWIHELGKGMGKSLKLNLPLQPFTEGDSFMSVIEKAVVPALSWFRPDAIVVQAGADPHYSDPLADLMLTTQDFERIYRRVLELADKYAKGNILITFGGGYSITATTRIWTIIYHIVNGLEIPETIPEAWRKKWQKYSKNPIPQFLHDPPNPYDAIPRKPEIERQNNEVIRRLLDAVSTDWW
jgi:acetoin utilization protein AcuC